MNKEIFPLTEQELTIIIQSLDLKLQDYSYEAQWPKLHEELLKRKQQLQELTIINNTL